jgi:nucleoside-diphosphate-sugar epimerase
MLWQKLRALNSARDTIATMESTADRLCREIFTPSDNFHPNNSHVMTALIRRFHEAVQDRVDEVVIWGSGAPRQEFLHVDDMAVASLVVLD